MTPEQRISSGGKRWWPLIRGLTVAVAALVLTVVVLLLMLVNSHANSAGKQAQDVANCVNNVLGERAPLTAAESEAQEQFVAALTRVLIDSQNGTAQATVQREFTTFVKATQDYQAVLARNQVVRKAHPLGKC